MSTPNILFPPYQGHSVTVSVINGATCRMPAKMFFKNAIDGEQDLRLTDYCFFIESIHRDRRIIFDLGFMKNFFDRLPPQYKPFLANVVQFEHVQDVPDIIFAHGIDPSSISSLIWSHAHIDHVGDPSVFPPTTELVVGPGVKRDCIPGYPVNEEGAILDSAFNGRPVREIDFSASATLIGGLRAVDFFDDGSFWLLETPGHVSHHLSALCRTTEETFVFLGGDVVHSPAQFRPNKFRHLPEHILTKVAPQLSGQPRPIEEPIRGLAAGMYHDLKTAEETVEKLKTFDGSEDVMIIVAHDWSLQQVIDMFPASINNWKAKGWADQGRWLFVEGHERAACVLYKDLNRH